MYAAARSTAAAAHFKSFVIDAPQLLESTPLIISQSVEGDDWSEMGEITVD